MRPHEARIFNGCKDMTQTVEFAKMNGLGNKILVVDMRGRKDMVSPQAAIALNADPDTAFDQIMAIHDPRLAGTDAYIDILNCDGTKAQACGNGTRCVVQALAAETGKKAFTFQTVAGILNATEHADGMISVDMGQPRFHWRDIPLSEEFHDTSRIELQIGPIDEPVLHSPAVMSMGNPHAIFWVDRDGLRFGALRAALGKPSDVSGKGQYHTCAGHLRQPASYPYLRTRRGPDACLRIGGLRCCRLGGAHWPHRSARRDRCGLKPNSHSTHHRMARGQPRHHDRSR